MKIITTLHEMQMYARGIQLAGKTCGFVPTMGALHEGHRSLIQRAREENDEVVVSIFVNPLQFGPNEDLKRYPRTKESDLAMLKAEQVNVAFMPSAGEMYPAGFMTQVSVPTLENKLCGPFRPGHFRGVATVVAKLFELTLPTRAYFGEKDYQQVRVIHQMVQDLRFPLRVVACPTMREKDGLACSSRNRYLSKKEREEAVKLYQSLFLGRELIEQRIMSEAAPLVKRLKGVIATIPRVKIDYVEVVDPTTLEPMKKIIRPAVIAAAIWIGKTRLIDNVVVS